MMRMRRWSSSNFLVIVSMSGPTSLLYFSLFDTSSWPRLRISSSWVRTLRSSSCTCYRGGNGRRWLWHASRARTHRYSCEIERTFRIGQETLQFVQANDNALIDVDESSVIIFEFAHLTLDEGGEEDVCVGRKKCCCSFARRGGLAMVPDEVQWDR